MKMLTSTVNICRYHTGYFYNYGFEYKAVFKDSLSVCGNVFQYYVGIT